MFKRQANLFKRRRIEVKSAPERGGGSGEPSASAAGASKKREAKADRRGGSGRDPVPTGAACGWTEVGAEYAAPATCKLPRGCGVTATVPLPPKWSSGDVVSPPVLISVGKLFAERPSESEQHSAGHSDAPKLEEIGRRDLMSDVIRSMENRLVRHGILAAPATILGKRRRSTAAAGAEEDFYDGNDGFIDDGDLEELNAYEEARAPEGQGRGQSRGEELVDCGPGDVIMSGAVDAAAGEGAQLDLAAFRLAGLEVSGTSDASCSQEGEQDDALGVNAPVDSRSWREQLEALPHELAWVPVTTEGVRDLAQPKTCPGGAEAGSTEEDASMSACDALRGALAEFCEAVEKATKLGERGLLQDTLEVALRKLLLCLPHRLRRPALGGREVSQAVRCKLIAWEMAQEPRDFRGTSAELLPWTPAEEIAWARYVWCLIHGAAPNVKATSFVHQWMEASKGPQRQMLAEARAGVMENLTQVMTEELRASVEAAVQQWNRQDEVGARAVLADALHPLHNAVQGLQSCWLRQVFWKDQRNARRLALPCQSHLAPHLITPFAVHIAMQLKGLLGFPLPLEMLVLCLQKMSRPCGEPRSQGTAITLRRLPERGRATGPPLGTAPLLALCLPIRLPTAIHLAVKTGTINCILRSVKSLEEQKVVLGTGTASREFNSLADAAGALLADLQKQHSKPPEWPAKMVQVLKMPHGAWFVFRISNKTAIRSLAWAARTAFRKKIAAFENAPDAGFPCPVLALGDLALSEVTGATESFAVMQQDDEGTPACASRTRDKAAKPARGHRRGGQVAKEKLQVGMKVKYMLTASKIWRLGTVRECRHREVVVASCGRGTVCSYLVPRDRIKILAMPRGVPARGDPDTAAESSAPKQRRARMLRDEASAPEQFPQGQAKDHGSGIIPVGDSD